MKNFVFILFTLFAANVVAQTESLKLSSDVWPPFTNVEEEKSIALDIVAEALESINITTHYEIVSFDLVMDGIATGTFDGSAALWWSEEREEEMIFSDPYLQNQLILVGAKGSNVKISSFSELTDKKIGVVEDYAYGDSLLMNPKNQIVYSNSDQQNLERLLSKEIDYFLVDALLIQYLLQYQLNDVSEFLEIGKFPLITKSLHMAIRQDIPDAKSIIDQFNKAITAMIADGSYNEILELSWVRADIDGDGTLELIFAGNEAGKDAPDNSYDILYSEKGLSSEGYYVNGVKYNSWNDVPENYKVDIPDVNVQKGLDDATMKIRF